MTARFLSREDRVKAVVRVRENMTGIRNNTFQWAQCREALLDSKAWLLVLIQLCANIPNGGLHSVRNTRRTATETGSEKLTWYMMQFSSIVIEEGLGFDTLPTLLLTGAGYLGQIFLVLFANAGSSYFRNTRTYFMVWNLALGVVGSAMIRQVSEEQKWTRYAGYCLSIGFTANFPLVLALVSGNFGGFTKKMTVNAMVRSQNGL